MSQAQVAVRLAQADEESCWRALKDAMQAWLTVEAQDPRYSALYHVYCDTKAAWHGASARLCRARGREHIRRIT